MKKRTMFYITLLIANFIVIFCFESCRPIREFRSWKKFDGQNDYKYPSIVLDNSKKNVVIVADNEGTEIFDLLAPYNLFNETNKTNVIIVAEKKYPIILRKGFFILPNYSFSEFDSLKIKPDVMVVPNLSAMTDKQNNPIIVKWIKQHFSNSVNLLSVCDGSLTVAATGIYDGKPLTTHSSDFDRLKSYYNKPVWTENVSVTQNDNLYSTAGVSNAVEGTLTVIKNLFDEPTMIKVKEKINYPYPSPKLEHKSTAINLKNKLTILNKVFFKGNKRIGVYLENGIDEFVLAAILDTYNRTFPKSIHTYSLNDQPITSKNGLIIIPTGKIENNKSDEVHLITASQATTLPFGKATVVQYNTTSKEYIFNQCLDRIKIQYGDKFNGVVKLMLDYN
jgi:putative intracellular protease/amidase